MSRQKDFVIKGPPLEDVPDLSLGQYLLAKMRELPRGKPLQVDADTGAVQSAEELLRQGARVAEGLRALGLREGDTVGLVCRNCFEACEVVLGTWFGGAAIAPAPGRMTVGEFKHFLDIAKPKFIFCEEEAVTNVRAALNLLSMNSEVILVGDAKNSGSELMRFQEVLGDVDVETYEAQPVKSPSTQLAAILSSSGTSGLPKGVGITHRNLIFQDLNMETLPLVWNVDFLQLSQFFWVTGVLTFLRCLTSGMKRVLLREPNATNALKAIRNYKPNLSLAAPLFVLAMVQHPDFEKFDVSSLKTFLVGGSPFTPSIGQIIKEKWPDVELKQIYGTTEASGSICYNSEGDPYAIGSVTPGVQLKVIDTTTGECLKANCVGEILIKTPGMMACYVGNEEAYRKAVDADGWFHTADIGYYDDSENFYIVDRMKEMVKISSMQVSPSEVEGVILLVPGVLDVAVVGVTKDGNTFDLLAMVVKDKTSTVTEKDIQDHVAGMLSEYKRLNGGVHFVESLPRTPTGKIHRSKLKPLAQNLYSGQ